MAPLDFARRRPEPVARGCAVMGKVPTRGEASGHRPMTTFQAYSTLLCRVKSCWTSRAERLLCTAHQSSGDRGVPVPTVVVMNQSRQFSPALLQRAELQAGIFTKRQVTKLQSTDSALARAISNGTCHRVEPGLFSLHPMLTGRARLWAGLLLGGPEARLGGDAARFALGEGPPPETVDVWTGHSSRRERGCWRFHPGSPPKDPKSREDHSERAMGVLLTTRGLQPALLSLHAERQLDIRTRAQMLGLLNKPRTETSSILESQWRIHVESPHELPPVAWARSTGSSLRTIGSFSESDVRIALQSFRPHLQGGSMWERWEKNASDGPTSTRLDDQLTVSLHWDDVVERPCQVAEEVSRALIGAGSSHVPLPCSRCPRVQHQPPWAHGLPIDSCPTCGSRPAHLWTPENRASPPLSSKGHLQWGPARIQGG